jgi:hypothetical protein
MDSLVASRPSLVLMTGAASLRRAFALVVSGLLLAASSCWRSARCCGIAGAGCATGGWRAVPMPARWLGADRTAQAADGFRRDFLFAVVDDRHAAYFVGRDRGGPRLAAE